jgi:PUA domain protein
VQVDRGAIKFVLKGADIMCPGLTSPGGRLDTDLPKDTIVAIFAEGKEHPLAIGKLVMSTDEMYIFLHIHYQSSLNSNSKKMTQQKIKKQGNCYSEYPSFERRFVASVERVDIQWKDRWKG